MNGKKKKEKKKKTSPQIDGERGGHPKTNSNKSENRAMDQKGKEEKGEKKEKHVVADKRHTLQKDTEKLVVHLLPTKAREEKGKSQCRPRPRRTSQRGKKAPGFLVTGKKKREGKKRGAAIRSEKNAHRTPRK